MAEGQSGSDQEKTEEASGHKREESRKHGSVAKSLEVNSAVMIIAGLTMVSAASASIGSTIAGAARNLFLNAGRIQLTVGNVHSFTVEGIISGVVTMGPLLLGMMAIGAAVNFMQVGFMFSPEILRPKLEKFNPLVGLKRMLFTKRSMVELGKNLTKLTIVGIVAYKVISHMMDGVLTLMDSDPTSVLDSFSSLAMEVALKAGGAFLILAVLDFAYQRYDHEQSIKMTKDEVKEETKMMEGNPLIKSRLRSVQRQVAYKRMMHEVPKADVVITNPTHLAVALQYDMAKMGAPTVTAKGAELIAQRIKEIARENDIPIVEDKPLARALYKSVKVGEEIPEQLFQTVAQMLAYIYKLKNSTRKTA
ncbi:MAG: flagellar biosynthesis protein FlhB [Ignavibacteriales bacterium]|nr:flagellar biosynthesis protein FlhB [Ignavibacteriales bacterium]